MNIVVILRRHWLPLWHPFFERLVSRHGVRLTVVTPPEQARGAPEFTSVPTPGRGSYCHASVPCRWRIYDHEAPMVYSAPFREVIADARPDLIYVIGEAGYLCTYQAVHLAGQLSPRPRVCLYAAQNIYQRWPPPFRQTERFCLDRIDMLFPLGEEHEAVARRKGYTGPARQVPLGVDHEVFRAGPPANLPAGDRPVVGFVGKLTRAKGVDVLLRAAAASQPRPHLLVIGTGPLAEKLRGLAASLGVNDSLTWLPAVRHHELPAYYSAMDVLVLPSRQVTHSALHWWYPVAGKEQFGRVLTEAMACERPVIGSDCGEIPRIIADAGRVFREDDVEGLTGELTTLLGDAALRAELGQRGRRRVLEHYTWDQVTEQYHGAWRELVSQAPR